MESLIYSFKCLLFHWLQLLLSKCKQILKNGFSGCKNRICYHKFKLDARHNDWTKKDIQNKLRDFPNITLAGLESAIVTKRHLVSTNAPM